MILRVGDPHVTPNNLDESERLLGLVCEVAKKHQVSRIELLGDLFNTHQVIDMRVLDFWHRWAMALGKIAPTIALVGNHDQILDTAYEGNISALDSLKYPGFTTVSAPYVLGDTSFFPFTSDEEKFKLWCQEYPNKYLVCHQTFNGAKYESGMYAPDGFDTDSVRDFDMVYVGHIHTKQEFSNILCVGTARWSSISDANEKKAIWLFEGEASYPIYTDSVCVPIVSFDIKEGDEIPNFPINTKVHLNLIGTSSWIASMSKKLQGKARLTPSPTDAKANAQNFKLTTISDYAKDFKFSEGVEPSKVLDYLDKL